MEVITKFDEVKKVEFTVESFKRENTLINMHIFDNVLWNKNYK